MIAQLTGILIQQDATEIVLDVNGVGYAVSIPLSTCEKLPQVGEIATVKTHMTVREDDIHLYGFATESERSVFRLLTGTVSGIGPRLALNVLSAMSVNDFAQAVLQGDLKRLSGISGIGKRTAERIVVELRDKAPGMLQTALGDGIPQGTGAQLGKVLSSEAQDAIRALERLEFSHNAAEKAITDIIQANGEAGQSFSTQELIRRALASLKS